MHYAPVSTDKDFQQTRNMGVDLESSLNIVVLNPICRGLREDYDFDSADISRHDGFDRPFCGGTARTFPAMSMVVVNALALSSLNCKRSTESSYFIQICLKRISNAYEMQLNAFKYYRCRP